MSPPPCPRSWPGTASTSRTPAAARRRSRRSSRTGNGFGVVLLDLGLPDQDGYEVCGKIRKRTSTPVIMVTARADVRSRIHGLNLGADDYVVKPYDTGELLARIHAVARRTGPPTRPRRPATAGCASGPYCIELPTRQVSVDGSVVQLTRKEFDLLALLAQRPGVVFRREQIISEVWRTSWEGTGRTLEVHVASLRVQAADARPDRDRARGRLPARRPDAVAGPRAHSSSSAAHRPDGGRAARARHPARREPRRGAAAGGGRRPDRRHGALRRPRPVRHRRPSGSRAETTDERGETLQRELDAATTTVYGIQAGVFYRDDDAMASAPDDWCRPTEGEGREAFKEALLGRRSHDPPQVWPWQRAAGSSSPPRSSATATSSPSSSPTRPPTRCARGSCAAG